MNENFFITTSIPYVNGEPHLGHAYEYILSDVLARRARQEGKPTILSTGTDEHGGKIEEKANQENIDPKEFADKLSQKFVDLAKRLNISYDKFVRTTDVLHENVAQNVWNRLKKDIYKAKYAGWYCTGGENFVTDSVFKEHNGVCPDHKRPYEKVEEENYFFRLSKYSNTILEAIKSGEFVIIPDRRKNEILNVIEGGLEDISISRPKDKISWGISVPNDVNQVIYVWFEALLNYISVLDYPDGEDFKAFWPADYQVIGKDIIRFHAAIWPGILLALDLPLPKILYVHGFINVDNQKMSKSLGNVVDPYSIIDKYGVDAFRYYFLRHIPSYDDGDFSWEKLHNVYHNELGNDLGNAVQRVATMVANYTKGAPIPVQKIFDVRADAVYEEIKLCKFDQALSHIWAIVRDLNQQIDEDKPWVLHRDDEHEKLEITLHRYVTELRLIANLLQPFLPDTSTKIAKIFSANISAPKETLFPRIES